MPTPPTDPPDLGPEQAPGRHGRARTLARRRSEGEQLTSYEDRLLRAHISACERCSSWVAALPAAEPTGQAAPSPVTVAPVEVSGGTGLGEARQDEEADAESERPSTPAPDASKRDDESDLDAMGKPKRRAVVGQGYGPTKARQLVSYVAAIAVIIGLYFGAQFAIKQLDTAPAHDKNAAPWAQKGASQAPPQRFQ